MFARVKRWLLVLVPKSRGTVAPVRHGRGLLLPRHVHNDIRWTLLGCVALSAEEEDIAGGGIRMTLGIAIREALVFSTLGFLEKGWK